MPDLDNELAIALDSIEELLLHAACWMEDDPDEPVPSPIGDGTAFRRISEAVRPTQGVADGPRLLARDGRYEHLPLRPVVVAIAGIECLVAASVQLRSALAGGCGLLADAIDAAAGYLPVASAEDLVCLTTRLAALLGIDPMPANRAVWQLLADADGRDILLTPVRRSPTSTSSTRSFPPGTLTIRSAAGSAD